MNDTHAILSAWGVWYDRECRGPKPHTDAHPWAKQVKPGKEWEDTSYEPTFTDEELERAHEAYTLLARHNRPASLILVAHYRDWRLGERKHPQPFPDGILRTARNHYGLFWRGLSRAA